MCIRDSPTAVGKTSLSIELAKAVNLSLIHISMCIRDSVYSAGGLGNKPAFGVRVAEGVAPDQILYYIRAMHELFCAYGNYENRAKARSRFMQEALGGAEAYKEAFLKKLDEVYACLLYTSLDTKGL